MKALKKLRAPAIALCLVLCFFAFLSCGEEEAVTPTGKFIDISEYVVVIPDGAGATLKYAAENFVSLINEKTGASLPVITDSTAPVEKEILIGNTNRTESKTNTPLDKMQYLLFAKNEKIVMQGNGIYVGAACGDFVNKYSVFTNGSTKIDIVNVPCAESAFTYSPRENAKSVIFMIGDGMGFNHILMAEKNGLDTFVAKEFPFSGESVTRSQSVINKESKATDSAASGTAMATGYKTINGYIGIDKNGQSVPNIRELAYLAGSKTAVITTDVITGATPSAFMCHQGSRNDSDELQAQIDALVAEGKIDYCAGDVADNLTVDVKNALACISKNGSSFFIMVEEGQIDKASHAQETQETIDYVVRFDDSIEYATQFALCHPDTALIVTADHETGKLLTAPLNDTWVHGYAFRSSDHTNVNVPIYAIGAGTSFFADKVIENIELAKFCARAYSIQSFGQTEPIE